MLLVVVPYGFMYIDLSLPVALRTESCFIGKVCPPGTGMCDRGLARTSVGLRLSDLLLPQDQTGLPH